MKFFGAVRLPFDGAFDAIRRLIGADEERAGMNRARSNGIPPQRIWK
jgi:hypothetical protein